MICANSVLDYTDNYTYDLNSNRTIETEDQGNTGSTTDTITSTYPGAPGFRGLRDAARDSFRHGAAPLNTVNDEITQAVDANTDYRWPFSDIGTGSGTTSLIYVEPGSFAARLGEATFIPAKSRRAGNSNGSQTSVTHTPNGTTTPDTTTTNEYDLQGQLAGSQEK